MYVLQWCAWEESSVPMHFVVEKTRLQFQDWQRFCSSLQVSGIFVLGSELL